MEKNPFQEPKNGVLTEPMDVGSEEFDKFQAMILNKVADRTKEQKTKIELLALKFQMEDYVRMEDAEVKTVGYFLKSFLQAISVRQNKFAKYIGLQPSNLSKLINGERTISHEMALIFGRIFQVEPMLWLNIQSKNELKKLVQAKTDRYRKYSLDQLMEP